MRRRSWFGLDRDEWAGAPILVRELGLWRALKTGHAVRHAVGAGDPFAGLEPADCPEEAASRDQIGRAIVLYRVLREAIGAPEAFRVTRAVVVEAGSAFLSEQLGSLRRSDLEAIPASARSAWLHERGKRFFNATIRWDRVGADGVEFTVTACRFPRLCAAAGCPELAPVFCAADERFFGTVEPDVRLDRPRTIADGAPTCLFRLSYAERSGEPAGVSPDTSEPSG